MDLFYLNSHLKNEDKEKILEDFISAELAMSDYDGDDHPAVNLHRVLIGIIFEKEKLDRIIDLICKDRIIDLICKNSNSEVKDIIKYLKSLELINA